MYVTYLRQVETVLGQLGADEVLGYLDTVVQVSDLHTGSFSKDFFSQGAVN